MKTLQIFLINSVLGIYISLPILQLHKLVLAIANVAGQTEQQQQSSPQILGQNLENLIRPYVGYITFAIDVSAGVIIGISAIMALIAFFKILREPTEQQTRDKETIRLRLARGMLLALDFEVGSDILKTILVPSMTELTTLAVVVGIRIVLSWSLSKEINRHVDMKTDENVAKALQTAKKQKDSYNGLENRKQGGGSGPSSISEA